MRWAIERYDRSEGFAVILFCDFLDGRCDLGVIVRTWYFRVMCIVILIMECHSIFFTTNYMDGS